MRILVAGAGIAGLTFAALMKQRGRDVELIDPYPSGDDYPLVLTPIGSRVLHGFGILRRFRAANPELDILRVADVRGKPVGELDLRLLVGSDERCRIVRRSALLRLLNELGQEPAIIEDAAIESITEDGAKVAARLSDGAENRYDLVVGADGIDSVVREKHMPERTRFATGWGCWTFPVDSAEAGRALEYWGSGRMLGLYSGAWEMSGIVCAPERKLRNERKSRLQKIFRRLDRNARAAIDAFPDDSVPLLHRKLEDSRSRRWVRNRVALLGDAACALLPTSPLGASLAMESAAVLADEISRAGSKTIPQALAHYEKRCRARTESVQDEVRKNARHLFSRNPLAAMTYDPVKRFADYRIIERLMAAPV